MANVVKRIGFPGASDQTLSDLVDFLNSFSQVINFTVATAGTEVKVTHELEYIPRHVFPVLMENDTVSFANVYPGSSAWTKNEVYLTATLPGTYHIILRR